MRSDGGGERAEGMMNNVCKVLHCVKGDGILNEYVGVNVVVQDCCLQVAIPDLPVENGRLDTKNEQPLSLNG